MIFTKNEEKKGIYKNVSREVQWYTVVRHRAVPYAICSMYLRQQTQTSAYRLTTTTATTASTAKSSPFLVGSSFPFFIFIFENKKKYEETFMVREKCAGRPRVFCHRDRLSNPLSFSPVGPFGLANHLYHLQVNRVGF